MQYRTNTWSFYLFETMHIFCAFISEAKCQYFKATHLLSCLCVFSRMKCSLLVFDIHDHLIMAFSEKFFPFIPHFAGNYKVHAYILFKKKKKKKIWERRRDKREGWRKKGVRRKKKNKEGKKVFSLIIIDLNVAAFSSLTRKKNAMLYMSCIE